MGFLIKSLLAMAGVAILAKLVPNSVSNNLPVITGSNVVVSGGGTITNPVVGTTVSDPISGSSQTFNGKLWVDNPPPAYRDDSPVYQDIIPNNPAMNATGSTVNSTLGGATPTQNMLTVSQESPSLITPIQPVFVDNKDYETVIGGGGISPAIKPIGQSSL